MSLATHLERVSDQLIARATQTHAVGEPEYRVLLQNLAAVLRSGYLDTQLCGSLLHHHRDVEDVLSSAKALESSLFDLLEQEGRALAISDARLVSQWSTAVAELVHNERVRRYQSILDAVPDFVVVHDEVGRWVYVNESACKATGLSADQIVGRTPQELGLHPQDTIADILRDTARAFAGESGAAELFIPIAQRWIEHTFSPLRAPDGAVVGALFVTRDIHDRKTAGERLRMLSAVGSLSDALEHEGVLSSVANLSVQEFADLCVLDVIDRNTLRRARVAHTDPAYAQLAEDLGSAPFKQAYKTDIGRAVLAGKSELLVEYKRGISKFVDSLLDVGLDRIVPKSVLVLPFMVMGKAIAVATFVRTKRAFDELDLTVAEEGAGRAAHLVENARLHQELRDRDASLRVALAKSNICVFELDAALRTRWIYNPVMGDEDTAGSPLHDRMEQVLKTGQRARTEYSYTTDGETKQVIVTFEPLRGATGSMVGLIGTVIDVTEEKRIQRDLTNALEFRDRVIGVLGHDLRNPLAAILGIVGLAKLDTNIPELQRTHLAQIDTAARRMFELIKTLLDFTQARFTGRFPITLAQSDLRELLERVVAEARAGHPSRTIELAVDGDVRGEWDGARIAQVIANLVGNALNHGDPHTPVRISASGDARAVEIQVQNKGLAISAELVPVLFEPFRRGDSSRPRGLGLGLYIVQQIVLAHGGTVDVRSTAEEGTMLMVRLPKKA